MCIIPHDFLEDRTWERTGKNNKNYISHKRDGVVLKISHSLSDQLWMHVDKSKLIKICEIYV